MKFVVDMNLSPAWCVTLQAEGWDAVHWSTVSDPRASDVEIMRWAASEGRIVVTHDLDFSALLAATGAHEPSVIQLRAQDIMPLRLGPVLVAALKKFETVLTTGAIVVVDDVHSRVRVLPLA